MIELIIALILSVGLNVFLFFYLRWLLGNFTFLSENTINLLETAENFSNHLSAVYELETFYGDETLQNLLTHAKQAVKEIEAYKDVCNITTRGEEELGDLFDNDTETDEEARTEEEQ